MALPTTVSETPWSLHRAGSGWAASCRTATLPTQSCGVARLRAPDTAVWHHAPGRAVVENERYYESVERCRGGLSATNEPLP